MVPPAIQRNSVILNLLLNSPDNMSLKNLIKFALLTTGVLAASYAIVEAQTGNTGGSSGGTGSGQSGVGSGPAATAPSTGGDSFSGNPDANPYAKGSTSFTETTTSTSQPATNRPPRKRTTTKSSTHKSKKHSSSASPSPSASASPASSH